MTDHPSGPSRVQDGFALDLTRRPPSGSSDGQLAWESTITAPTEWVPYAYTTGELRLAAARRTLSTASAVVGILGLLIALFTILGAPLSLVAVVLAVTATQVEPQAKGRWMFGLVTGVIGLAIATLWLVYILNFAPGAAS